MNEAEVLDVLEAKGAVLRGHFQLSSGRHSDVFVQKFRVLEHPRIAQALGEELARSFAGEFDLVACPAVGAVVLGFTTALAADTRMIFAERADGVMEFRRGFSIEPGQRTLVVEDVITTGGSALEVVELVKSSGGDPVGIAALIDRGDPAKPPSFGVPLRSLVRLDVSSWDPDACPLCAEGIPLADPGSRRLDA
ncbi:MAG: orotate phosphoribosyltransferase [Actinomycetota bacterium]|nr:orotate phosphoribosyltransferase [Actinomycetota bacterium]